MTNMTNTITMLVRPCYQLALLTTPWCGQVLGGMRVLKMYGWEEPFRQLVERVRGQVSLLAGIDCLVASTLVSLGIERACTPGAQDNPPN